MRGPDVKDAPKPRRSLPLARLLPIAVIIAGFVAFFALGWHEYLSFETLREHRQGLLDWREANPFVAALSFIGIYCAAVALSVPGAIWLTIAGGFLFGPVQGTAFVVLGATAGAVVIFLAARYALADYFRSKAGPAIRRMENGFRENALSYLLVLRLVPIFPFWLINIVPAFLGVSLATYTLATGLGIIPGAFVYSLVGNGLGAVFDEGRTPDLGIIFDPEILAPIIGLALLSLIPVGYKKLKRKKSVPEVSEETGS